MSVSALPPLEMRRATVELSYDDVGAGRDVLLLVHGHPFDRRMWSGQAEFAAQLGWRVICPDLRGYGATAPAGDETTLDLFAADLAALLDRLKVRWITIGGLSMGGQIAMAFCAAYPERVRGLFLAATFETPETDAGRKNRQATAARLLREGMTSYVSELLPQMLAAQTLKNKPKVVDQVAAMMAATPASGAAAALLGRAKRPDYTSTLKAFSKPSTIVVGDQDKFTSIADARRMHALLQGSELVVVGGSGHMPNLELPQATNAALGGLLRRVREHLPLCTPEKG